jgi:ATP-binding cassette, subfamily G (WHITE), member 2, SNQ2
VRPYATLSDFWRYWLYYLNPSTYWIGGVLAATLNNTPVRCTPQEAAYFNPPPGSTCSLYAQEFVDSAAGYLINPVATKNCGYCQYSSGIDYMRTLNIKPEDKWRYFGIFLAFCISNWALVYFFIYTVRMKRWTFGFGYVLEVSGKTVEVVKGLLKGRGKRGG